MAVCKEVIVGEIKHLEIDLPSDRLTDCHLIQDIEEYTKKLLSTVELQNVLSYTNNHKNKLQNSLLNNIKSSTESQKNFLIEDDATCEGPLTFIKNEPIEQDISTKKSEQCKRLDPEEQPVSYLKYEQNAIGIINNTPKIQQELDIKIVNEFHIKQSENVLEKKNFKSIDNDIEENINTIETPEIQLFEKSDFTNATKCKICKNTYFFSEHLNEHFGQFQFVHKTCGEMLRNNTKDEIELYCTFKMLIKCPECEQVFDGKNYLEIHFDREHTDDQERRFHKSCTICGDIYLNDLYDRHMTSHFTNIDKKYWYQGNKTKLAIMKEYSLYYYYRGQFRKCLICHKIVSSAYYLLLHEDRVHLQSGKKRFHKRCYICGRLQIVQHFQDHLNSHLDDIVDLNENKKKRLKKCIVKNLTEKTKKIANVTPKICSNAKSKLNVLLNQKNEITLKNISKTINWVPQYETKLKYRCRICEVEVEDFNLDLHKCTLIQTDIEAFRKAKRLHSAPVLLNRLNLKKLPRNNGNSKRCSHTLHLQNEFVRPKSCSICDSDYKINEKIYLKECPICDEIMIYNYNSEYSVCNH